MNFSYGYPPVYPAGSPVMSSQSPAGLTGGSLYPQAPQQAQQTPVQGFVCRPVTSREEAVAVQVDVFGPGTVMPDLAHGMVYLKRFNQNTGASDFLEFAYRPQETVQPAPAYDPRVDIESIRSEMNALRSELDEIKKAGRRTAGKGSAEA